MSENLKVIESLITDLGIRYHKKEVAQTIEKGFTPYTIKLIHAAKGDLENFSQLAPNYLKNVLYAHKVILKIGSATPLTGDVSDLVEADPRLGELNWVFDHGLSIRSRGKFVKPLITSDGGAPLGAIYIESDPSEVKDVFIDPEQVDDAVAILSEIVDLQFNRDINKSFIGEEESKEIKRRPQLEAGQKRFVVAIFADIVGSTTFGGIVEADVYTEEINKYLNQIDLTFYKYGGNINKHIGDASYILFNALKDQSKPVSRAVAAGLETQLKLAKFNSDRAEKNEQVLEVRIGINCGPAIVGVSGSDIKKEFTAMGDTINIAQKIQSKAIIGGVCVTKSVIDACEKEGNPLDYDHFTTYANGGSSATEIYIVHGFTPKHTP